MSSSRKAVIEEAARGELLDWDSTFFGIKIARLHSLEGALLWCAENAVVCAYFLADADDSDAIALAEAQGFHLRDVRMTLKRTCLPAGEIVPYPLVRGFRESDMPAMVSIARRSHQESRFYQDSHFSRVRCDELYETWIRRSCLGWANAVFVAEIGQEPIGYLTCHLSAEGRGSIGLFAVDEAWRGKGAGRQLVDASLDYFRQSRASSIEVITQGRNIRSQRLYQRCGFLPTSLQFWYHLWTP